MSRVMFSALQLFVRAVVHFLIDWKASGTKNIPHKGPVILVANHLSMLDPLMIALSTPGRRICYVAKEELFSIPGLVIILKLFGSVSIKRGTPDRRALEQSLRILKSGRVLGMFPEGTRSQAGELQEGQRGAALLALHSGAPVVPVGITGTKAVFEGGKKWPRRSAPVQVTVGLPIYLAHGPGAIRRHELEEATGTIMRALADLLPEEQRGWYRSSATAGATAREPTGKA